MISGLVYNLGGEALVYKEGTPLFVVVVVGLRSD